MKKCKVEGCNRDHAAKGYCKSHYRQWKQWGFTKKIRETITGQSGCKVNECKRKHWAKGYCRKHYDQHTRSGYTRKYFVTDPNEFVEKKDTYEIILCDRNGKEKARAIIDKDSYEKCKNIKWGLTPGRCQYAKNSKVGYLHHFIWGKKESIDHINRIKLDCRKSNLRKATPKQNAQNRGLMSNNTSGATGVRWSERLNKWRAQIYLNGKNRHLGLFIDKNDAITAYQNAADKHFGQYRRK